MKRVFTAAIVATILLAAIPAQATTFPSLTLIYTAVGVADLDGSPYSWNLCPLRKPERQNCDDQVALPP